jgi:hypothetical protein
MKKQSKKINGGRGGKRKGAGQKPKPIDQAKPIQKGFRCSLEVGWFLAEVGTGVIEGDHWQVSELGAVEVRIDKAGAAVIIQIEVVQ